MHCETPQKVAYFQRHISVKCKTTNLTSACYVRSAAVPHPVNGKIEGELEKDLEGSGRCNVLRPYSAGTFYAGRREKNTEVKLGRPTTLSFYLLCILYCGCFNLFCNMWVCVCMGVCMYGFCNVWVFW